MDNKLRYAGFWIRSLAIGVDYTILALPFLLFNTSYILLILLFDRPLPVPKSTYLPLMLIVLFVISSMYFVGFTSSKIQGTIGKRVCNIFIGNSTNASRIKKTISFGRFAFLGMLLIMNKLWKDNYENHINSTIWIYLFVVFVLLLFSFLLAAITTQKTTLQDILFKTRVYHGQPHLHKANENISSMSNYLVFGILLILWGAVIPLFRKDLTVTIWCAILFYVLCILITLIYYKRRSPEIYTQYSPIKAIGNLKLLFWSLIPTVFLLIFSYGIILYVKITMG